MFTGIVTHRGALVAVEDSDGGRRRLVVEPAPALPEVVPGASVAVDGVCLTVAGILDAGRLAFDVVPETLRKTTLGRRRPGDVVNLEPSLKLGDEMGGHWVQGHVEGQGEVVALEQRDEDVRLVVRLSAALFGAMIPKGSVTLDGVSLTLGEVWQEAEDAPGGRISVYLVPHTLAVTGLGRLGPGDGVNVEPDVLGRWVEHHVERLLGTSAPAAARGREEGRS